MVAWDPSRGFSNSTQLNTLAGIGAGVSAARGNTAGMGRRAGRTAGTGASAAGVHPCGTRAC